MPSKAAAQRKRPFFLDLLDHDHISRLQNGAAMHFSKPTSLEQTNMCKKSCKQIKPFYVYVTLTMVPLCIGCSQPQAQRPPIRQKRESLSHERPLSDQSTPLHGTSKPRFLCGEASEKTKRGCCFFKQKHDPMNVKTTKTKGPNSEKKKKRSGMSLRRFLETLGSNLSTKKKKKHVLSFASENPRNTTNPKEPFSEAKDLKKQVHFLICLL